MWTYYLKEDFSKTNTADTRFGVAYDNFSIAESSAPPQLPVPGPDNQKVFVPITRR